MPRQNRVNPFGEIVAVADRGTFLGNRGVLHDPDGRVRRAWQVKRWLICVLEFRGRKRQVMAPDRYTELFFLDEATALAAGHRPCAECRYARFIAFCAAWAGVTSIPQSWQRPAATEIDNVLHAERLTPDRRKRTYAAPLDRLPDGVLISTEPAGKQAWLIWKGELLEWSASGYGARMRLAGDRQVMVLTPPSTVAAIRAGYVPEVHSSAGR